MPGSKEFYVITNTEIYEELRALKTLSIQLRTLVYVISLIVTPTLSTVVALVVQNVMK